MNIIDKIAVDGIEYALGGIALSYTEPTGANRLPLWICPNPTISGESMSPVGDYTTKAWRYYSVNENTGELEQQTSTDESVYNTLRPSSIGFKTVNDDYIDSTHHRIINSYTKIKIKPLSQYKIPLSYDMDSGVVGDHYAVAWFDSNDTFIRKDSYTLTNEDLTNSYAVLSSQSPVNACYCILEIPYGVYAYNGILQEVVENAAEQGIYILNTVNNEYYKEGTI